MEKTLKVINRLEADGVIGRYAIGGAVAAIFYTEPFQTYDLDIFFAADIPRRDLLSLSPIYDYLAALGYEAEGESVEIEGWPVQFLPAFNPLIAEAIGQAIEIKFKRTPTRVMRAEHLAAIMLRAGRAKDYARLAQLLEEDALNVESFKDIISRHGLTEKWHEFQQRFRPAVS